MGRSRMPQACGFFPALWRPGRETPWEGGSAASATHGDPGPTCDDSSWSSKRETPSREPEGVGSVGRARGRHTVSRVWRTKATLAGGRYASGTAFSGPQPKAEVCSPPDRNTSAFWCR